MAGFRETPRQKMIGMMYLVLMALLALNVSVEVLEAFVTVNESMEATNENFSKKIEATYYSFEQQNLLNQARVGPFYEKAIQVKEESTAMIDYLNELRVSAIANSERISIEQARNLSLRDARTKDKYDRSTNFFINEGRATQLKQRIESYKDKVLSLLEPVDREKIKFGMNTEGPFYNKEGKEQTWEYDKFYHTILAANVTMLNKMINEVQNAEYDIINLLFSSVDADSYKFDAIAAKVIPSSNFVFLGDKYEAEILVAAFDTKSNPEVLFIDGADKVTEQNLRTARRIAGKDGSVKISIPATSEGVKRYAGAIQVPDPYGQMKSYYFNHEFVVGKQAVTVSADNMNVFYAGIDNPISFSAVGKTGAQLDAKISVGDIRKENNQYIVRVPASARNATVSVTSGGQVLGTSEFRIKTVPNPVASIGGVSDGSIEKETILRVPQIVAAMPRDFEFRMNFQVTSFRFYSVRPDGNILELNIQGNTLNAEAINFVQNMRRGQRFTITNIVAKGPDGLDRVLNAIVISIQ